jgi:hypothetical protein
MQKKDGRVAKFMLRFDRPFEVMTAFPEASTYTLHLPDSSRTHQTFHSSLLRPHIENNDELFPSRALERLGPIVTEDGEVEYYIDEIIDEQTHGQGK